MKGFLSTMVMEAKFKLYNVKYQYHRLIIAWLLNVSGDGSTRLKS